MRSPFLIDGPAVIGFSGGRTSALMLYLTLDAHGGQLPPDVLVGFENTGREDWRTLAFVDRCSREWGVPVTWLERTAGGGFRIVDFATASRDGEPFDQLLAERAGGDCPLPGYAARFCSVELKTMTERAWMLSLGFMSWTKVIGIRVDEPKRIVKYRGKRDREWDFHLPLAEARIAKSNVILFWKKQPFDLGLRSFEGNCDFCFLKGIAKTRRLLRERPEAARWWIEHEQRTGKTFRLDRPSLAVLAEQVNTQATIDLRDEILDGDDDFNCTECGGDECDLYAPLPEPKPKAPQPKQLPLPEVA